MHTNFTVHAFIFIECTAQYSPPYTHIRECSVWLLMFQLKSSFSFPTFAFGLYVVRHTFTHTHIRYNSHNECSTHAHQQPPSYQSSANQSNSKRINTSETVEYALSKGTATEIGTSNSANKYCRFNCSNNNNNSVNTSFEKSADSDEAKIMSASSQNRRDRLGAWGNDSEVAATVSGLDRLRLARFNKVSH